MYIEKNLNGLFNLKAKSLSINNGGDLVTKSSCALLIRAWGDLNQIYDPELGISINALGLVYSVFLKKTRLVGYVACFVVMTLTSYGCPAGPNIVLDIKNQLFKNAFVTQVNIFLTWNPYWSKKFLSEEVCAELNELS